MSQEQGFGASSQSEDRAATPSEPSQSSVVSGVAGIPCAGPWTVWVAPEGAAIVKRVYRDDLNRRATQVCNCFGIPNKANAQLISAAPELYDGAIDTIEALKLLLQHGGNFGIAAQSDAHIDELEYATAKARGEIA